MIPAVLEEWNIEAITDLLKKGYYESEFFDFKEMLPCKSDESGKKRLMKACCAFANSNGGFLVFGISDDKTCQLDQRLKGLPADMDFPEHFGNFPKQCNPSIDWSFKNPPVQLSNGKMIHIVHINKSWNGPHCIGGQEQGFIFTKRTNKGDEGMSYEEVRMHFLGHYEKTLKLQLLRSELENIIYCANLMKIKEQYITIRYSLATFELRIIESVLSDVFTILATKPDILKVLSKVRTRCRAVNNKIKVFYSEVSIPRVDTGSLIESHNMFVLDEISKIIELSNEVILMLGEVI